MDELDPLDSGSLLTADERATRARVAEVVDTTLLPLAPKAFASGEVPAEAVHALARAGAFDGGAAAVARGLRMQELERADSGLRVFASTTARLVIAPLRAFGSEAQQARWLQRLETGDATATCGVEEPLAGADPAAMQTRAVRDGDAYRLTGLKRRAANAARADVAVVWAKLDGYDGRAVRAFLVERADFEPRPVPGSLGLRASAMADLVLHASRAELLPGASGAAAAMECLDEARFDAAWGAIGAAIACWKAAREFAASRKLAGRPLASHPQVHERLAAMARIIGPARLTCVQIGRLKERGALTRAQLGAVLDAHLALALDVARSARELLAEDGDVPARHVSNLEALCAARALDALTGG